MDPADMDMADKAERLFELVLERPPEQRDTFLDDACAHHPELGRELAALLPYAEADPDFLAIPVLQRAVPDLVGLFGDGDGQDATTVWGDPPEEIGGYRIVRILGYGGMAVVYEARQQNPERSVALKLLCPGPVTPGMKRRFNAEAQLLGRLRHPGIAQIFEAGVQELTDPRGGVYHLPFLVMELVSGCRLDAYVSRAELSLEDRLRLFAKICDAVDHAHRHGVLHRDLKPANILVEESGQPKILDFGIARSIGLDAVGPDAEPSAPLTATGQILGSLAYMSPEQLNDSHHVDARSDVYALGVILYQVLAGRLPYEVSHLSVTETAVLIETTEPAPMATFDRACRGDLRTITSKAMAKDRSRRYGCAAQLAADVRRHLDHLPIHARPASLGYRLCKLVRRNPAAVYGLAAVMLVLALGAAVALLGLALAHNSAELRHLADRSAIEALEHDHRPLAREVLLSERGWEWHHVWARAQSSDLPHQPWVLRAHGSSVRAPAFSPCGEILACGDTGGPQPLGILNKWAFFFREAENLEVIPPELDEEPFREALEVARMAGFSAAELEVYDRSKMAEQDARGALAVAESQGRTEGLAEGLRHTVEDLCELLGIELSETHSDFLASATVDDLEALRARLKRDRRWDPAIE